MNREVLFRGKASDGSWRFGSIIKDLGYCLIFEKEEVDQRDGIAGVHYYIDTEQTGRLHKPAIPVDPDTVGMWTGKEDWKGTLIFEDDIIFDGQGFSGVVKWWNGCFVVKFASGIQWDFVKYFGDGGVEILGNYHDNPDLVR